MSGALFAPCRNGVAMPMQDVPDLGFAEFRDQIIQGTSAGKRLACLCADADLRLYAVLADDRAGTLRIGRTRLDQPRYPSLTPLCPQAHLFEREMAEQYGLVPEKHPWFKPVRYHAPWAGEDAWKRSGPIEPGVGDFYRVEGEEVHEVAVGPVHAGVIEPGHFRFQCHGEKVFHLEIALGYQHRGIERAMEGGPHPLSLKFAETAAGDTTIGHGWAYCQALEGLAGIEVPARTQWVRGIALELERCANHTGDLGALSGDVGFLPTASYCGRIRGDWLNLTAELCGSRLGRDWLAPGGLRLDLEPEMAKPLAARLARTWGDTQDAVNLLWGAASVLNRFEAAGFVDPRPGPGGGPGGGCRPRLRDRAGCPQGPSFRPLLRPSHGAGPGPGRPGPRAGLGALAGAGGEPGLPRGSLRSTRGFHRRAPRPGSACRPWPPTACASPDGGLAGRGPAPGHHRRAGPLRPLQARGPLLPQLVRTGAGAARGEQISDFPLCNKSFNLSYCGHDL